MIDYSLHCTLTFSPSKLTVEYSGLVALTPALKVTFCALVKVTGSTTSSDEMEPSKLRYIAIDTLKSSSSERLALGIVPTEN